MHEIAIIMGLLAAVAALVPLAARLRIPYPILLVLGGLALGFIPGVPTVALDPELVLLVFLPPLLYWDALNTSWRDFKANIRPISSLAIGLVIGTTGGVALVAHYFLGLPWGIGFVLGAIVSPTDAVAASAIASRLGIPHRIVSILEGESLVNDATALVVYGTAVAAVVSGSFSLPQAGVRFVAASVGGVLLGLLVGWGVSKLRSRISDSRVEGTVALLTPFVAYLPADLLGASGVLAAVAAGLYLGRRSPVAVGAEMRLRTDAIWELGTFLINGLAFILIGLEFQEIMRTLDEYPLTLLLRDVVIVGATVIAVRILWVYPSAFLARLSERHGARKTPWPSRSELGILAWTGLRGVIALATALALPQEIAAGPFPARSLILFVTFGVILMTLVGQGLTLPPLIRWLGLPTDDRAAREELLARRALITAALERLEDWAARGEVPERFLTDLRGRYERRLARLDDVRQGMPTDLVLLIPELLRDLYLTERRTLVELRNRGVIDDAVLRRIQRELDLEEVRFGSATALPPKSEDAG